MSFQFAKIIAPTTLAVSGAILYTNPNSATKTYINSFIIHNSNTTTENVSLYNVPNSGSNTGIAGDNTNRFFYTQLASNDTASIEIPKPGIVLTNMNETIQGKTTTANKVVIMAYGATE